MRAHAPAEIKTVEFRMNDLSTGENHRLQIELYRKMVERAAALAAEGFGLLQLDDIIYTHLDRDHAHPSWSRVKQCRATSRLHIRHRGRAEREGHAYRKTEIFDHKAVELGPHLSMTPLLSAHDQLGVAVFRFDVDTPRGRATLGFATDVGTLDGGWVEHLAGVDVLAVESNYCPRMQAESDRPAFLKRRITGGSGHLANEQAAEAARAIAPRAHTVLLHLSRQCNTPDLALRAHADSGCPLTVTDQHEPTDWIWATPGGQTPPPTLRRPAAVGTTLPLFAPTLAGE